MGQDDSRLAGNVPGSTLFLRVEEILLKDLKNAPSFLNTYLMMIAPLKRKIKKMPTDMKTFSPK